MRILAVHEDDDDEVENGDDDDEDDDVCRYDDYENGNNNGVNRCDFVFNLYSFITSNPAINSISLNGHI